MAPKAPHKWWSCSALEDLLEPQQGSVILPRRQHIAFHAHGRSLGVSTRGSKVCANETKTCKSPEETGPQEITQPLTLLQRFQSATYM